MIPVEVVKVSFDSHAKTYAVVLKETGGDRFIPIIIGSFEAQSIALALESIETPRPLTHDLICDLINFYDGHLKAVRISNIEDGIYIAHLEIESQGHKCKTIDSRPSDAITVALKTSTPILISPSIINESSVHNEISYGDEKKEKHISLRALKQKLASAIEKEEYEMAAKLRDKIIRLES